MLDRRSFFVTGLGTAIIGLAGCPTKTPDGPGIDPLPPDPSLEWLRSYGEADTHEDFGTLVATRDGGFLAGGARIRSDYAGFLVRTDRDGDEQWRRILEGAPVRDAVETPEGGSLVLLGQYGAGENELVALNADGTTRWQRSVKPASTTRYEFTELVHAHGGGYLLAGTHIDDERRSPVAVSVTRDGRERWERLFPAPDVVVAVDDQGNETFGPGTERANGIVSAERGYLLLCETSEGAPYVRRLESTGRERWRRYYGRGYNNSLWTISQVSDGYVLAGQDFGVGDETSPSGPWLLAIDADGEPRWSYLYQFGELETPGFPVFMDVAAADDGAPVVTGMHYPERHRSPRFRPILGRFSPDGAQARWVRQYGDRDGMGRAVVRAPDGSFVLAGELAETGPWSDALLVNAGHPTESNVGPVRSVEFPA